MLFFNKKRCGRCMVLVALAVALMLCGSSLVVASISDGEAAAPDVGSETSSTVLPSSYSSLRSETESHRVLRSLASSAGGKTHRWEEHKTNEGESGHEGGEDESGLEVETEDATMIVCIVLVLIGLTVAFEMLKNHAEENSSEEAKLVIEKLFGELTVLGFLAMMTFIVDKAGAIKFLSDAIHEEEKEVDEYLECVHYTIFCIMLFFVVQVMVLLQETHETEKQWLELEDMAQQTKDCSEHDWDPTPAEQKALVNLRKASWYTRFMPQLINRDEESLRDRIIFQALRDEFILDRSLEPPFEPTKHDRRLPEDFNFGRYLSLAQTHILMHIVEVENGTWFYFAASAIAFYLFAVFVEDDLVVLAWIWAGLGWFVFFMNVAFERHLKELRRVFMPKTTRSYLLGERQTTETTDTLSDTESEHSCLLHDDPDRLPSWCDVCLEEYRRPCLTSFLVGGTPNRQQVFYLLDRRGSQLYMFLLQVNLIFTGLYAAMLLLVFFPVVVNLCRAETLLLYTILSVLPIFAITYNKKRLVAALTQVCSVGTYRKVHIVGDVLRESKLRSVVRTFVVLSKVRCLATTGAPDQSGDAHAKKLSHTDLQEIGKTFDALDDDGNGQLSPDELRDAMRRLSLDASEQNIQNIVATFDSDGDGEIDRDEFIEWYAHQSGGITPQEHAREVFKMLDSQGNGEISVGEFKHKMDGLHFGFTLEDISGIISELDEDRSGTISLDEFENFLEKYYPSDLD